MSCLEIEAYVNELLDGECLTLDEAAVRLHLRSCASCRERVDGARLLKQACLARAPERLSGSFAEQLTEKVIRSGRRRRLARRFTYVGLATAVAASCLLPWLRQAEVAAPPTNSVDPVHITAVRSIRDQVDEAREALASLTWKTADATISQARSLWPEKLSEVHLPSAAVAGHEAGFEIQVREAAEGVGSGLEPVKDSAIRAFTLFAKEIPALERQPDL